MSKTSAIYHKDDKTLRAINIAGKWQIQRRDNSKGTPTNDPWFPCGEPKDEPPAWTR